MKLLDVLAAREPVRAALRAAVVVAHPDDEVIGAGSRLARLRDARIVYLTDGAPRDGRDAATHGLDVAGYRALRQREREAALGQCGIAADRIVDLAVPDQQASLQLAPLSRALAALLERERIEALLTQAYEGGHPDHDATAFVAHAAAALCGHAVEIVEMTGYHAGPQGLETCSFLADADADAGLVTVTLTTAQARDKQALIDAHASQRDTLKGYPLVLERFRPAPDYDFTAPPHEGSPWYERHDWGMSGARFRELAAEALDALGLARRR